MIQDGLSEFFRDGTLVMSAHPYVQAAAELAWSDVRMNKILVIVAVIFGLLAIRNHIELFPRILYCLNRPRASISFEYNHGISRARNSYTLSFILLFCLFADRFALFRPQFWSHIPPGWSVVATMGVFIGYVLLRVIFSLVLRPRKLDSISLAALRYSPYNYFIMLTVLMLLTAGLPRIFHIPDEIIRIVMLTEITLFFLLSLIRGAQILAGTYSGFSTILYLCGLEILPTSILVACAVLL